tara:strand:- start:308 stop:853 length:546 start_codon:yes stop_codon:yes gene_type:complete
MGVIKPTISLSANANTHPTVASRGPLSVALSLTNTDSLNVDFVEQSVINTSTTQQRILDGHVLGGATKTPGTIGCYIYMKNTDTTVGNNILVGVVSGSRISVAGDGDTTVTGVNNPTAPHEDDEAGSDGDSRLTVTNNQTLRTFTLLPGEFAWFPFDYTGDIYVQAAQNTPALEYWRFDKE